MNFIDKYNHKKNIRFEFFKKTLEIAKNRDLKIIVETGTSRGKNKFFFFKKFNWKDGMSTLMFSEFADFIQGELHSCDISKKNIENAIIFTKKFKDKVNFYVKDSVSFLKDFPKTIDLLYLDSFDGHNVELASKHQLKEIEASIDKLKDNSLVLLDDKGAKTLYSSEFLVKNNFNLIHESNNQLLFSRSLI